MFGSIGVFSIEFGALLLGGALVTAYSQGPEDLRACGDAFYSPAKYTCYEGDFLCPVINGEPTLKCGRDCYLPQMYFCADNHLVYPRISTPSISSSIPSGTASASSGSTSSCDVTRFHLSNPPYENYFYCDCHASSQVVVTSPLQDSNLTVIGPRLLIAWPAGNSGVVGYFAPRNGVNGTLSIQLENSTMTGQALDPVYVPINSTSGNPRVGVTGVIKLNSSAVLSVAILGSIRTIRDFVEGPSILVPEIQEAIQYTKSIGEGATLSRLWLDNKTTTEFSFTPISSTAGSIKINNRSLEFEAGSYQFNASFDYPQLQQLNTTEVLNPASKDLITQYPDQATSLSFLSYTTKLLAGAWRFLTYFGRDSMISLLLLQPVLSEGEGGAIEAVIGAVLERINSTDGSACHEETIGDYATYLNQQDNVTSTAAQCDYKMIDTDYYLPVVMENYFVKTATGSQRASMFLDTQASVITENQGLTYADLAQLTAEKIMKTSAPFVAQGGQTKDKMIHLKEDQIVGQWRDSTYGIGGGRIPYDVNTALVSAALRSVAALSTAGLFPMHPEWSSAAAEYAQVWEDKTLQFFEVTIPEAEAKDLVSSYISDNHFSFPSHADNITSDVTFHGLALDGDNGQSIVKVVNSDDCFRHYLLNTTNQTQLSSFLDQTADHILQPFPAGLSNPVGLFIANPAYGGDPVYSANWTNSAYHGTVVWSWQLAMMAAGLERQLDRCSTSSPPNFCADSALYSKVKQAYNHLWDLIDANQAQLSGEVWSWLYLDGGFQVTPLGTLAGGAESDIRQLWSLTFLAVSRNEALR